MAFEGYKTKDSVVIVYTGEGKGKTSAGLGLTDSGSRQPGQRGLYPVHQALGRQRTHLYPRHPAAI